MNFRNTSAALRVQRRRQRLHPSRERRSLRQGLGPLAVPFDQRHDDAQPKQRRRRQCQPERQ